jgi:hypothetical protein
MVDDFLDAGDSSSFLDELEEEDKSPPPSRKKSRKKSRGTSSSKGFLGMTPIQTFIISAMFFFIVCLVGFFFMIFTGKMVVSF